MHVSHQPLRTEDLDYDLPAGLIATRPAEPRHDARLLVVRRGDESFMEHARVRDLPRFLAPGDALVFNTSAVAPARFRGRRAGTGGRVDGLFVEERGPTRWLVMLRSNGRLRGGDRVELLRHGGEPSGAHLELLAPDPDGWVVAAPGAADPVLDEVGLTPLPPYILGARAGDPVSDDLDRQWYQTVYADPRARQSVAAPTAGLHFTAALLDDLESCGVGRIDVTLHVGPGTFRPITAPTVAGHAMHAERFSVTAEALTAIARTPGRVIGVGSTAVRVLESLPADADGPLSGSTDLLIAPPYRFRRVDGMLTNFHLPRTTLLALVAAMVGLERLAAIYAEAVRRRYRFYSYGDAMLILP